MNTMKTSEVLDLAADEIQRRGWLQAAEANAAGFTAWGGGAGSNKPVCLEGGIMAAMGIAIGDDDIPPAGFSKCPAYLAVHDYLNLTGSTMVFHWNDTDGRTAEEVIEVLRAAAAVERTKEIYEDADQPLPVEIPAEAVA